MKEKSLTLAGASSEITRFLQSSPELDQRKKSWLLGVQKQIKIIHEGDRDFDLSGISNPSQKNIMEQEYNQYISTITGLITPLNSLALHIINEKEAQDQCSLKAYIDLIVHIKRCVEGLLNHLVTITKANVNEKPDFVLTKELQSSWAAVVMCFGGRYYPFAQEIDPFFGMEKNDETVKKAGGYCYGYTKIWADDIKLHGMMTKTPRLDEQVLYEQQQQNESMIGNLKNLIPSVFFPWSADIGIKTNFPLLFNKMLACLDQTKTYGLCLYFNEEPGHIIGIRHISATNEYEIFNSSCGIMVFNNRNKARDWLIYHFFSLYKNNYIKDNAVKGTLTLKPLADQPEHAQSSLPMWKIEDWQEVIHTLLKDKNWGNTHKLDDAGFWARHDIELVLLGCFCLTDLSIAATTGLGAFAMLSSGSASLGLFACILCGTLAPPFVLGLGVAIYASFCIIEQYRHSSSVGFFAMHGSKNHAPSKDEPGTIYNILPTV